MQEEKIVKVLFHGREQDLSSTFSILTGRGDGDSLEFGRFNPALGWTKSSQDGGNYWFDDGPILKTDIQILLSRFGLDEKSNPRLADFETVRYMSPVVLVGIRRAFETMNNVPRLEVISDRVGGHIPADMFNA